MQREIKFRAWHSVAKSMSPVALNLLGIASQGAQAAEEKIDYRELLKNLIWLQFTGLKDKTGKEIYEGDILKTGSGICEVKWYEKGACFRWMFKENSESPLNYDDREVIGNIFENSELLK